MRLHLAIILGSDLFWRLAIFYLINIFYFISALDGFTNLFMAALSCPFRIKFTPIRWFSHPLISLFITYFTFTPPRIGLILILILVRSVLFCPVLTHFICEINVLFTISHSWICTTAFKSSYCTSNISDLRLQISDSLYLTLLTK